MGMVVNPYLGQGVSGFYAFAYKSTDQGAGAGVVTFDLEVSDLPAIHSTGKFVIPAAWNGRYGRLTANIDCANGTGSIEAWASMLKGGVSFIGKGGCRTSSVNPGSVNVKSAPIALATGDEFEIFTEEPSPNFVLASLATWGQMQLLPAGFKGALVYKSAGQAISADTETDMIFGAEVYDTDAFHDNATNNTRLTIPSGVSLVRLYGNLRSVSAAGQLDLYMWKNGAIFNGSPLFESQASGADISSVASAPLAVSAADYFTLRMFHTTAQTLAVDDGSWFAIEVLASDLKYALVNRITSNFDIGVSAWTAVSWNNELADAGGWWAAGSPTIFTVPSGIARVEVSYSLQTTSATGDFMARIKLNGAVVQGTPSASCDTTANDGVSGLSAILDVVAGDTISVEALHAGGADILVGGATWFAINEVRDAT